MTMTKAPTELSSKDCGNSGEGQSEESAWLCSSSYLIVRISEGDEPIYIESCACAKLWRKEYLAVEDVGWTRMKWELERETEEKIKLE